MLQYSHLTGTERTKRNTDNRSSGCTRGRYHLAPVGFTANSATLGSFSKVVDTSSALAPSIFSTLNQMKLDLI